MASSAEFEVVVQRPSFERSSHGQVTGVIFVQLGQRPFPDAMWSDSVPVVLAWWLRAVLALLEGKERVEFRFMDGPFVIEAVRHSDDQCVLTPTGPANRLTFAMEVPTRVVVASLVSAGREALAELRLRAWVSRDIARLEQSLSQLVERHAQGPG